MPEDLTDPTALLAALGINEKDLAEARAYRDKKYPPSLVKKVKLNPDEDPAQFFNRLFELFPGSDQRAYIKALQAGYIAGAGIDAIQLYRSRTEIPQKLQEYFPRSLNNHLVDFEIPEGSGIEEHREIQRIGPQLDPKKQ